MARRPYNVLALLGELPSAPIPTTAPRREAAPETVWAAIRRLLPPMPNLPPEARAYRSMGDLHADEAPTVGGRSVESAPPDVDRASPADAKATAPSDGLDGMTRRLVRGEAWLDACRLPEELLSVPFMNLWRLHPPEKGRVFVHGEKETPRWQQSYGADYWFSGLMHKAAPVPALLQPFVNWTNALGYGAFQQVLVNWYQDGHHYIGAHSDDERQLVPQSPIVTISLGQTRKFRLRPKRRVDDEDAFTDLLVHNGDVLVMGGTFQKDLTHEIVKVSGKKGAALGARISITLRQFR
jgi:alkylated DNA repair dioxygenase AlkB